MTASLERMREEALRELRQLDEALALVRAARAEQGDDEHDPEGSTAADDWSRFTALRSAAAQRLAEIDRALRRREQGDAGRCLDCGLPIPPERLAARPTAERCRDCAERAERRAR